MEVVAARRVRTAPRSRARGVAAAGTPSWERGARARDSVSRQLHASSRRPRRRPAGAGEGAAWRNTACGAAADVYSPTTLLVYYWLLGAAPPAQPPPCCNLADTSIGPSRRTRVWRPGPIHHGTNCAGSAAIRRAPHPPPHLGPSRPQLRYTTTPAARRR
jgi:hypothetical protein